jgi:hypothetical protein
MNLGELLERVYREIHTDIVDGVATGGSATTIVDSTLSTRSFTENKFKDWIAFISRTTGGLTPQSKYGIATAYVKSTGTITIPTVTDSVGAGDEYALCKPDIPLYTLIKLCNDGIKKLGRVPRVDTSLTTASSTVRYTIPIAGKGIRPRSIHLRDSDDYDRYDTPPWKIEQAAGGTAETLVFMWQPLTSKQIVIEYMGMHPALTAYSSYVNEHIHDDLAIAACLERAFYWRAMPKRRKTDMENWGQAKQALQEAKVMYPIEMPLIQNQRVPIGLYNSRPVRGFPVS